MTYFRAIPGPSHSGLDSFLVGVKGPVVMPEVASLQIAWVVETEFLIHFRVGLVKVTLQDICGVWG